LMLDGSNRRFHSEAKLQNYRSQLVEALRSAFPSIVFN